MDGTRTATYAQLYQHCITLATFLRDTLGVQRGTRVAVLHHNAAEVIGLHYAVAALRAVVVNLNTALAPQELAFILADSGAEVLVASSDYATTLQAAATAAAVGDELQQPLAVRAAVWTGAAEAELPVIAGWNSSSYPSFPSHAQPTAPAAAAEQGISQQQQQCEAALDEFDEELGYHMYYTSGTTGHPKGVVLSHKMVVLHAIGTIMGEWCAASSAGCELKVDCTGRCRAVCPASPARSLKRCCLLTKSTLKQATLTACCEF